MDNQDTFDFGGMGESFQPEDFVFDETPAETQDRYCKPCIHHKMSIKAKHAADLVKNLAIGKNESVYAFLSGRFIFGDFLEQWIEAHNIGVKKMHLATLSMSAENVMSLAGLIERGFIQELDLHISIYFYAHERHVLIPMIYSELDQDDKFQLVVSAIHSKICLIETVGGKFITIHGSANLRSSDNVEQIQITENKELYDFNAQYLDELKQRYKTINKPVRGKQMP